MSERPALKLKLSMAKVPKSEPQDLPPHPPHSASTPTATPSIKLKFGKKTPSATPAPQAPKSSAQAPGTTKPKPARKPKPTPKKRALEEDPVISSDDEVSLASKPTSGPATKKLRLSLAKKPQLIRIKNKGELPERPLGVGYDSEASDRELDPVITESIILRMAPGDDCDYLRSAIAAGNIGPKKEGGADVRLRFLRSDGRRACVTIRGNHYAAILVDLPCVIEAMKSWFPKQGWIKSADICQMLMVLGRIKEEHDALEYPLPLGTKGEFDEKTWQWAHGLTPPMHWVRKRRFRKRVSVRTVMEVEAEVEEMLRLDALAEGKPIIEDIYERPNRGSELASDDDENFDGEEEEEEEDAEGDFVDEQYPPAETPLDTIEGAEDEEAAHARMAEEYERDMMLAIGESADPASPPPLDPLLITIKPSFDSPAAEATPSSSAATPVAAAAAAAASSPEPESSDEDDEDLDEDQLERQQELQQLKDEVREVDELIKAEQAKLAATGNQLLKKRIVDKIKGLQQDRELKLAAAGQGE